MGRFPQQGIHNSALLGMRFVAPEQIAVAERAAGEAHHGTGQGGVTGKVARSGAAHPRLDLHQPDFRGADEFVVRRQVERRKTGL